MLNLKSVIILFCHLCSGSWDSAVGIATGYRLDDGSELEAKWNYFVLFTSSRPILGPTQSPIQWVLGALSPRGKAAGAWGWPLTSN
jgi:hypothetical protein